MSQKINIFKLINEDSLSQASVEQFVRDNDIDLRDNEGVTPLMYACRLGALTSVKLLLANGADPHLTTEEDWGDTALTIAMQHLQVEVILLLLTYFPSTKALDLKAIKSQIAQNNDLKAIAAIQLLVENINIIDWKVRTTGGNDCDQIEAATFELNFQGECYHFRYFDFYNWSYGESELIFEVEYDNKKTILLKIEKAEKISIKMVKPLVKFANNIGLAECDLNTVITFFMSLLSHISPKYTPLDALLEGELNDEPHLKNIPIRALQFEDNKLLCQYCIQKSDYHFTEGLIAACDGNLDQAFLVFCKTMQRRKQPKEVVSYYLKKGVNVNYQDESLNTGLMYLLENGVTPNSLECIKELVKNNAKLNISNKQQDTALILACNMQADDDILHEVVKLFLANNADVNAKNKYDDSALTRAISNRDFKLAEILLCVPQLDVNLTGAEGTTLLMIACWCWAASADIVNQLLMKGADVNRKNNRDENSLSIACELEAVDLIELLLSYGVETSQLQNSFTLLIQAIKIGAISLVEKLISDRKNINMQDDNGKTALMLAIDTDNSASEKLVKLLLDSGADVNLTDKDGMTPLMQASAIGNVVIVKYLLENDISNINAENNTKMTALTLSIEKNHTNITKLLLERGADVDVLNKMQQTLLHQACKAANLELVKMLLSKPGNVNLADKLQQTPLLLACRKGEYELVRNLIEAGADPNLADSSGRTPLMLVSRTDDAAIAELLLQHGADIHAKDKYGETAIEMAKVKVARLLRA